ncbi:MAG: hypothetical protein H0W81_12245 [Chloroflexi bacterium]|nr:hypothetical protein [Chloroflexota bacterium]
MLEHVAACEGEAQGLHSSRVETVQRVQTEVCEPLLPEPLDVLPRVALRWLLAGLGVEPLCQVLSRGDDAGQRALCESGDAAGGLDAGSGLVRQLFDQRQQSPLRSEVVLEDRVRRRLVWAAPGAERQ